MPSDTSAANVEFLRTLKKLAGAETNKAFAIACGQYASHMNNYLKGKKNPGRRVLKSCLRSLFEWDVQPVMEMKRIPKKLNSLPEDSGVYLIYDSAGNVLYVGKAKSFRAEVRQTLGRALPTSIRLGPGLKNKKPKIKELASRLSLYAVPSSRLRQNLEALLLRAFGNQTYNVNKGSFK